MPGGRLLTAVWALLRAASNAELSVVNCWGRGGMPAVAFVVVVVVASVVVVVVAFVIVVGEVVVVAFVVVVFEVVVEVVVVEVVDIPFPLGPFEWLLPPELDPLPTGPWVAFVLLEDGLVPDADGDGAPVEHAAVAMARAASNVVSRTNGGTVLALICCTGHAS